ncbi:MAG: Mor transcription activator family [Pseudomonadota bacterium]
MIFTTVERDCLMGLRRRCSDMTDDQRAALLRARAILSQHFPGETLKVYVPRHDPLEAAERTHRIAEALRRGESILTIAQREQVSVRQVRRVRGRVHP